MCNPNVYVKYVKQYKAFYYGLQIKKTFTKREGKCHNQWIIFCGYFISIIVSSSFLCTKIQFQNPPKLLLTNHAILLLVATIQTHNQRYCVITEM